MIDNVTRKAARVDVRPLTIEGILRATLRDRSLATGYLWTQILATAKRLWPDFEQDGPEPLKVYPTSARPKPEVPAKPFKARWRRVQANEEEDEDEYDDTRI